MQPNHLSLPHVCVRAHVCWGYFCQCDALCSYHCREKPKAAVDLLLIFVDHVCGVVAQTVKKGYHIIPAEIFHLWVWVKGQVVIRIILLWWPGIFPPDNIAVSVSFLSCCSHNFENMLVRPPLLLCSQNGDHWGWEGRSFHTQFSDWFEFTLWVLSVHCILLYSHCSVTVCQFVC